MTSGQQFNLRWNNHTNNILQVFMEQYTSEHLVDVTLSCQGQFLKAHKMILSACSPYFQELFRQHQVQHPVIIMNGMKFVDIKLVVEFMYRGEIKVLETELDGLLATAETLQVKGLSNVRNKYEKGDIQGSEPQPQVSRSDHMVSAERATSVTPGTPMHLRRKRRKRSDSPAAEVPDSGDKDDCLTTSASSGTPSSSEKGLQPFVQVTMKPYTDDDDLPATIKVEPPDIRDIDEEPSGWESPKLVIDLPESSGDQGKSNSVSPKPSPKTNKPVVKVDAPDFQKQRFLMDFPQNAPGTSHDNGDLAHQLLENQRERKQVSQWLRKRTGKIPRPPNAFMIFANEWRRKLAFQHPTESNKEISVRLGIMWKNLSSDTKESYYTASRQADEEHKRKYPGYYYSPKEARLRKTLKHDLAMARKGPKALEAMHLVKVLMTDGNDNPPYVLLQDAPQLSQQKEPQMHIARKKTPRIIRHGAPESGLQAEQNVQKEALDPLQQPKEALPSKEAIPGAQIQTEVDLTDEK
ncbi:hypothetical protein R5R35_011416 [Gryllus longicercus]|uniref:Uncharacterized protein n=1 Tax=Gryllus longicercus TaxID=2509291 RepID=A0AAN9YWR5_9ORTH|nr:Protein bric-a-brac 2 [Gryllus bimaculatus]